MRKYFNTVISTTTGKPILGAQVRVKDSAGDLATLYSDDGGTALSNPVETDANGLYEFYVENGSYDFEFLFGGEQLQTITDVEISEDVTALQLALPTGAAMIGTDNGRTLARRLAAQPSIYQRADFTIASVDIFGDSFMLQPNPHTSGDSIGQKYADLLGVPATISATSGHTSADGQTAIFGASVTAADHNVCAFGQNDAQYLGTGDTRLRQDDLQRIQLANLVWLGKAADDNKITVADMTSAGTWTADADLSGAFKSTEVGAAKEAAFTDCRYAVVLYKAKVGSAGRFAIELESDDTNIPEFSAAPESGWVPTNTGQTWAVMARVFDFGAVLPSASVQFRVTDGSGDVSPVAIVGFPGDPLTGPLLGIGDVSRRGPAGYATAVGSEVSVPIVNRVIAQASAQALALGINAVDLPIASVLDVATDLAADEFHPSETGAVNVAAAWQARVESAQGMGAARPDLLVQGFIQNSAGEIASGMALAMDDQRRIRFKRIGGSGIDLTGDREIRHTTGVYIVPLSAAGVPVSAAALVLTGDGNHNYIQSLIGDLVLGSAAGNKVRLTNTSLDPETTNVYNLGSSSKVYSSVWTNLLVTPPTTFAGLPAASAGIAGTRAFITDCSVNTFGATAAGGAANAVPVYCDGTNWIVG